MENPYAAPTANPYGSSGAMTTNAVATSTIASLSGTKGWVRFLSILLWIGVALMLGLGLLMATVLGATIAAQQPGNPLGSGFGIMMGGIYVVMGFLYIYPALKLGAYASCIGRLKFSQSVVDLDAALHEQRRFWKFFGVIMAIFLILYALIFIGAILVGGIAAMSGKS